MKISSNRLLILIMFTLYAPAIALGNQEDNAVSTENQDVFASPGVIEFVKAVAEPTASAETPNRDDVKIVVLGMRDGKEVVAIGYARGHSHGEEMPPMPNSIALFHVHHEGLSQYPIKSDWKVVSTSNIPNIVVSSDGALIWEAGRINGRKVYRTLSGNKVGDWIDFDGIER